VAAVSSTVELLIKAQQPQRALRALSENTEKLKKKIDATQKSFNRTGQAATRSATQASSAYRNLGNNVSGVEKTVRGLRNAFVVLGGAVTATGVGQLGIDAIEAERKIKLLSMSSGDAQEALDVAARAASRFGLSITEANVGVARLLARLKPMGLGLDDIESTFAGFNIAAKLAGATASESSGAFLQLTQALGSGVLRGQELNSILEQAPLIATAIALELNTTTGSLKKLGEEGKISSSVVLRALQRVEKEGAAKLEEAMKGPAQQFKNLGNQGVQLSKVLTENLLPVFMPLVQGATDLLKSFNELPSGIQGFIVSVGFAATAVFALTNLIKVLAVTKLGAFLAQQAALFQVFGAKIYFAAAGAGVLKIALAALPFGAITLALGFYVNKLIEASRKQSEFNNLVNFGSKEMLKSAIATRIETRATIENTIAKLKNAQAAMSKFGEDTKFLQIQGLQQDLKNLDKEFAELSLKLMDLQAEGRKTVDTIVEPGKGADKADALLTKLQRQFDLLKETSELGKNIRKNDFDRADVLGKINKLEGITAEKRQELVDVANKAFDAKKGSIIGEALGQDVIKAQELAEAQREAVLPLERQKELLEAKLNGNEREVRLRQEVEQIMASTEGLNRQEVENAVNIVAALEDQVAAAEQLENLYKQVGSAIESGIVNGIQSAIDGSKSLGESLSGILKQVGGMFLKAGIGSFGIGGQAGSGLLGLLPFAEGGYVSGPTPAMVGEGGEPEYVIPESKMRESMTRYSRGARGSSVIPEEGGLGTTGGSGGAAVAAPIDVRYTVERINSVDYVTADQFQSGMQSAAAQGAQRGEQNTLKRLQMSGSTRRRLGM
jgi:tape measure domain-containing protein